MTEDDLHDIQGLILRGYRKDFACHLVLEVTNPAAFKQALGDLASETSDSPFVTVAADWTKKPPVWRPNGDRPDDRAGHGRPTHCVNIGFTFDGLQALGLSGDSLASFPQEFREGAVARAERICDTGPSGPECWTEPLRCGNAHAIVSVYADSAAERSAVADEIGGRDGVAEIDRLDAQRLRGTDVEHFGYVDGLSQPTIAGVKRAGLVDPFPEVPPGEFILGQSRGKLAQSSEDKPPWDPMPEPEVLGRNGSFAAFRVMHQDVPAFEEYLTTESHRLGIDRELLAAKLCGRWRNGEPLVMRPSTAPAGTIPRENLNTFDYEATKAFPDGDPAGLLCPRGAHIRRAFPRSQRVIDDFDGFQRRIVRRGMPYGPEYDPADPVDRERGMVGMFICASIKHQFEYVMRQWINDGLFTGGRLGRTKDPMIGANDPADSRFVSLGAPRVESTGFPRFVTTRGCAYLFLPSMTALRHLAGTA